MRDPAKILSSYLNLSIIDLSEAKELSPMNTKNVDFAYNSLVNSEDTPFYLQAHRMPSFRKALLREANLPDYNVSNPLDLPNEIRTERWKFLCDKLSNFDKLSYPDKLKVIKVLETLGFHNHIIALLSKTSTSELSKPTMVNLSLCRAHSEFMLNFEKSIIDVSEIERVAINATSCKAKVSAALLLVSQYAKNLKNKERTKYWDAVAFTEIKKLQGTISIFDHLRILSIYYRASAFVPMLEGDMAGMTEKMELSREFASNLLKVADGKQQETVALENHHLVLESGTKEALALKNLPLAEARAAHLALKLEPFDSRYQLELAEVKLQQGQYSEAATLYHNAFILGTPATEVAAFMEGQCHEALGELNKALDCYLACLQCDPKSTSALEGLSRVAPKVGNSKIYELVHFWADERMNELTQLFSI